MSHLKWKKIATIAWNAPMAPSQRSVVLPTMVDQEKVQATYRNGVLELRLPKVEAAKPKRIAIQS